MLWRGENSCRTHHGIFRQGGCGDTKKAPTIVKGGPRLDAFSRSRKEHLAKNRRVLVTYSTDETAQLQLLAACLPGVRKPLQVPRKEHRAEKKTRRVSKRDANWFEFGLPVLRVAYLLPPLLFCRVFHVWQRAPNKPFRATVHVIR